MISAILSAGYNYDLIDADAIDSVGLGTHQILVLPPTDRIPVETLHKISTWVEAGGKVISLGHTPTLDPEGKPLTQSATAFIPVVPDATELATALHSAVTQNLKLTTNDPQTQNAIGFIRRKLPDADIYFVANTGNTPIDFNATFATTHKFISQWNPDDGTISTPSTFVQCNNVITILAPYGSAIYVFSDKNFADTRAEGPSPTSLGRRPRYTSAQSPRAESPTQNSAGPIDLSTNWTVTFTDLHKTITEPTLTDWIASPATLHYSGEAIYSRDFTLDPNQKAISLEISGGKPLPGAPNSPPEHPALGPNGLPNPLVTRPGPGMHAYYDPPIHEAAIVYINGQRAGSLWHPPYSLDISKLLKPGQNHIEIHVYNTALNAWSALPPHDYKPLIAKYGDRFQMQDLDKVKPIPSGILGTIHLTVEDSK